MSKITNKICLIAILVFQFLSGPDSLFGEGPFSISELIDLALDNHPKTHQSWWKAKRASALLESAKSTYYPYIHLNTDLDHGRDFKFVNGPDTNYTIIRSDIALSMMLYDFGERKALVNTAKMALLAARWDMDFSIQKVIADVLEKTYQLAYEEEAYLASQLSLEDARLMVQVAKKLYRAGMNPISDVYISKSALSLMQIESVKRKSLVEIQQGKLAAVLGLPLETPLSIAPFAIPENDAGKNLQDLLLLAENQRADLMSKRAKIAESAFLEGVAETAFYPKLSMKSRGGHDHAVNDKSNGMHYEIVLNLDVPLFDGFRSFYNTKAAIANTKMTEQDLRELELEIACDVLTFSRTIESAKQMLFFAEENLHNTHKAYTGTLDKYQIGEEGIAELTNAQKQLAEARLLLSGIKTRLLIAIANLAYATGSCLNPQGGLCVN